jgi:hypothetical protein
VGVNHYVLHYLLNVTGMVALCILSYLVHDICGDKALSKFSVFGITGHCYSLTSVCQLVSSGSQNAVAEFKLK